MAFVADKKPATRTQVAFMFTPELDTPTTISDALTDHDAAYAPNRYNVYDINDTTDYTETESVKI
jgi:hypothetical protein